MFSVHSLVFGLLWVGVIFCFEWFWVALWVSCGLTCVLWVLWTVVGCCVWGWDLPLCVLWLDMIACGVMSDCLVVSRVCLVIMVLCCLVCCWIWVLVYWLILVYSLNCGFVVGSGLGGVCIVW